MADEGASADLDMEDSAGVHAGMGDGPGVDAGMGDGPGVDAGTGDGPGVDAGMGDGAGVGTIGGAVAGAVDSVRAGASGSEGHAGSVSVEGQVGDLGGGTDEDVADSMQPDAGQPDAGQPDADGPDVVRPSLADPDYRRGVIQMLGLLGAGEYLAFERLVNEASLAPTLSQRLRVADIAAGELAHHRHLRDRLIELGADPDEAMGGFLEPLERYHAMTAPSDWLEGLVKAYVGDSIANDFYREIGAVLDEETAALVLEVCAELGKTAVVVDEVRAAIERDPRVAGRLALWGRRLVGEMLSQAQTVAAQNDDLADLIMSENVTSQVDLMRLLGRLTSAHVERMNALGLSP